MKIELAPRHVATIEGAVESVSFKLANTAHVYQMLSTNVYSDPVRAVIREICCNAIDAHTDAGIGDTPVTVHLPTEIEPWFSVRDYGNGMDRKALMDIYPSYGTSTKGDDEAAIGGLGIGCKSPFAIADTFSVKSVAKGEKYICSGYLGEDGIPQFTLLYEGQTNEPSGVEVMVSVRPSMIASFADKAGDVFRWFKTKPNCNIPVEGKEIVGSYTIGDVTFTRAVSPVVVMGGVAYPVNTSNLNAETVGRITTLRHPVDEIVKTIGKNMVINAPMGAVDFAISREELRYSMKTVKYIVAQIEDCLDKVHGLMRETYETVRRGKEGIFANTVALTSVVEKFGYHFHARTMAFSKTIRSENDLLATASNKISYAVKRRDGDRVRLRTLSHSKISSLVNDEFVVGRKSLDDTIVVVLKEGDKPLTKRFIEHHVVSDKRYLVITPYGYGSTDESVEEFMAKYGLDVLPIMRREDFTEPPKVKREPGTYRKAEPNVYLEIVSNPYDASRSNWSELTNCCLELDDVAYVPIVGHSCVEVPNADLKELASKWSKCANTSKTRLIFVRKAGMDDIPDSWVLAKDFLVELVEGMTSEDKLSLWMNDFSLTNHCVSHLISSWHGEVEKPEIIKRIEHMCNMAPSWDNLIDMHDMMSGTKLTCKEDAKEEAMALFAKYRFLRYTHASRIGTWRFSESTEGKDFYGYIREEIERVEKEVDND